MTRSYKRPFVRIVRHRRRSLRLIKRRANRKFRRLMRSSDEIINYKKFIDLDWNEDLMKKYSSRKEDMRK